MIKRMGTVSCVQRAVTPVMGLCAPVVLKITQKMLHSALRTV
jgi:hypothetical protein